MRAFITIALGVLLSSNVLATGYGNWKFIKTGKLVTLQNTQGLIVSSPPSGTGVLDANGPNWFGFPSETMPSGKTTMVMGFDFRSNGFFTAEPGAHLPILMGKWKNNGPSGSPAGYIVGRGIIIGTVSGHPSGCSALNIIEIESFRPTSNKLYRGSCSAGGTSGGADGWVTGGPVVLQDNINYHIDIFVSNTNYIQGQNFNVIWSLKNSSGTLLMQGFALDVTSEIPNNLGGWGIGRVMDNGNPNASWSIEFNNLTVDYVP